MLLPGHQIFAFWRSIVDDWPSTSIFGNARIAKKDPSRLVNKTCTVLQARIWRIGCPLCIGLKLEGLDAIEQDGAMRPTDRDDLITDHQVGFFDIDDLCKVDHKGTMHFQKLRVLKFSIDVF